MVCHNGATEDPKNERRRTAAALAERVQRLRLLKLAHSPDNLAAAVATVGLLRWYRLDREEKVSA